MRRRKNRVVVDTNLWISFLLTKGQSRMDNLFNSQSIILIFSEELLNEFIEVAHRPKFKKHFTSDDLQSLLFQMHSLAEFVHVTSEVNTCRDPKDNFLLSLAKDGKAHFLLTGDNDLLELKKLGKTQIITILEFIQEIVKSE